MSIYHYIKKTTSNVLPVAKIVNENYTIYNIRDGNAIYVWSKEYENDIQFPRDHKFTLYYIDINEVDMDKYCCSNTVK